MPQQRWNYISMSSLTGLWQYEWQWSTKSFGCMPSGLSTKDIIRHWSTDNIFKLVSVLFTTITFACCCSIYPVLLSTVDVLFPWTGASLNIQFWLRITLGVFSCGLYNFLTKYTLWWMPTPVSCSVCVGVCVLRDGWGVKGDSRIFQRDTRWRQPLL